MLKQLSIQNFALIDELNIRFSEGLSVITGETGAGKSILLGALRLILGERADHSSLKNQSEKCIIEGVFSVKNYTLQALFEDNDLDYWEETIIRREISPQGKSRNFINDTPTTLEVMKRLGERLIDIHSQHQSLQINDPDFQLNVIDALASNHNLRLDYSTTFKQYSKLKKQLAEVTLEATEAQKEEDYLRFQFEELEALNLQPGEVQNLEKEQEFLANSEEILRNFSQIDGILSQSEENALEMLRQVKLLMDQSSRYFEDMEEMNQRYKSSLIELEDIAQEISTKAENLEFDPNRQQLVEERLGEIHRLQKKHSMDNAEQLVDFKEDLDQKLAELSSYDIQIEKLTKALNQSEFELKQVAQSLSKSRLKVLDTISEKVEESLKKLGIPHAVLSIDHQLRSEAQSDGIDQFNFLFSANKGVAPQQVAKTASGGEISRLVLSIKALLADHQQLPTILFDEIDTGVSGEVADQMGGLLSDIAQKRQVISITHLPQIAAKGQSHYFVFKSNDGERTKTQMRALTESERINEIAKMLSGKNLSEAAINNAKELLQQ
jgi:DNA repair protein RecN (Recombination protein N)